MPILTPRAIKEAFPSTPQIRQFIEKSRATMRAIGHEKDKRLLIVSGPCSIHDMPSAREYAERYKHLASHVQESCFLVMRAFFEKSRTQHGWYGFLNDPFLDGSQDIEEGLLLTRELLVTLAQQEVPVCAEFLHPLAVPYFEDLITLGIIGARTSTSQIHRHLASGMSMPIGFKNSIDGNIESALNGIVTARHPQNLLTIDDEGRLCAKKTSGNREGYLVLRGSHQGTNYDRKSLEEAIRLSHALDIPKRFIIDCAHGNSGKCPDKQMSVFRTCLSYLEEGRQEIMGLMLESYLEKGAQVINPEIEHMRYGQSVTDPCLDWESTSHLIEEAHFILKATPSYAISGQP